MAILFRRLHLESASMLVCLLCACLDIVCVLLAGYFCFVFFNGLFPTRDRPFRCDDPAIMKPFKTNTISVRFLLSVCLGFPLLLSVAMESLAQLSSKTRRYSGWLKRILASVTYISVEYLIGFLADVIVMLIGKSYFGVLRPHFLAVCQPDVDEDECSGKVLTVKSCTQKSHRLLESARHSFPSGHSSAAVYSFMFLVFYLNKRKRQARSRFVARLCDFILAVYFVWAAVCCVSRVTDNWHHWTDVLGGCVEGLVISCLLFAREGSAIRTTMMLS
uniref:AcidPPc domain-containing protein n=1 Tax=Trichuris muris TaxID=70415 RepID=A0A5S6QTQ2_TRIMR